MQKKAEEGSEILAKLIDQRAFLKARSAIGKEDTQTAELMRDLWYAFAKRFSLDTREQEALNRMRLVSNIRNFDEDQIANARNQIFKAANALGMKLPSYAFASKMKTSGMDPQMEKYLLHGGRTPEPDVAEKIQESVELFVKYGWKVRKVFRSGSLMYTKFEYKDGFEAEMPESILEQPWRVRQEFIPALIATYNMVSRWTSKEPMSYQRLHLYIKDKRFSVPATEYAYVAATEYLKGKGFDFFHDPKTASQLEREWVRG